MTQPLLTHPALHGEALVFVSEDDLWACSLGDSRAHRLTTGISRIRSPLFSPDGSMLAFSAAEEGVSDLTTMPAQGGPLTRLTWEGADATPLCTDPVSSQLWFSMKRGSPFRQLSTLAAVPWEGGCPTTPSVGPAAGVDVAADGRVVLLRHQTDLEPWRRYRGGRAGRIWVQGPDGFEELPALGGNLAGVRWTDDGRLLFVSDHDGTGNLFSTDAAGDDLQQHTHHQGRTVRFPALHGSTVVYEVAGTLHRLDLPSGEIEPLTIATHSQRTRTQRRHVPATRHLEDYDIHPEGHHLTLTSRGKPFVGGLWEGPLVQLGPRQGVRHRLTRFLHDGSGLIWVSDLGGTEHLQIGDLTTTDVFPLELDREHERLIALLPGPLGRIAIVDRLNRVGVVQLDDADSDGVLRSARLVWLTPGMAAESPGDLAWSADGRWLAFAEPTLEGGVRIVIADLSDLDQPSLIPVTDGRYRDRRPDFDPLGRYLTFISHRDLDPVRDQAYFGYSFPRTARPMLVTLQRDEPSPLNPPPRPPGKPKTPTLPKAIHIDLEGLADRVVALPFSNGNYSRVIGLPSGRLLLLRQAVQGASASSWKSGGPPPAMSSLHVYDFQTAEMSTVHTRVTSLRLSADRKTLALRQRHRLRVFPADADKGVRAELLKNEPAIASRKTGWIDLERARLAIEPPAEWRQMLVETWRLMRDHYWSDALGGLDWDDVLARYLPEVERVSTRSELTTLLLAMQGELGTSHAYVLGGDHAVWPVRTVGRLAADFCLDDGVWTVARIHRGDPGDTRRSSPLVAPGVGLVEGTRIQAIDGRAPSPDRPLEANLIGHGGRPVALTVRRPDEEAQTVWVTPLHADQGARLRTWVADVRARVHAESEGRVGYVYIPDMGPGGFADFHLDYLRESERDGLIVDVRYNGGGHVSQLILARLLQRPTGFTQSRGTGRRSYPAHTVPGPLVALANEHTGSDGDIFVHHWKHLGLGPVVGTRTWGGVVGIRPQTRLVDDTMVTQPEFATALPGAGFGVEGVGVEPTHEVRLTPEDHAEGRDPQLDLAIQLAVGALESAPPRWFTL